MSLIFTVRNSWLKLLADSSGWHQRLLEWPRSSSQWSGGAWFTTKSQTAKPATHATCRNHDETDERNESGKLDNNAYCLWTANLSSNPAYLLGISHIIVWWGILCPQGLGSCGNLQSIALLKSVSAPKGQEMWYSCWCASAMPAILHAACHMLHASSWYHYCRCCCWWLMMMMMMKMKIVVQLVGQLVITMTMGRPGRGVGRCTDLTVLRRPMGAAPGWRCRFQVTFFDPATWGSWQRFWQTRRRVSLVRKLHGKRMPSIRSSLGPHHCFSTMLISGVAWTGGEGGPEGQCIWKRSAGFPKRSLHCA